MKNKVNDRGRGTSPAELRSSGPKLRPEEGSVESSALDGESTRRGVPADDRKLKKPIFVNEDEEYCAHLAKFFKGKK